MSDDFNRKVCTVDTFNKREREQEAMLRKCAKIAYGEYIEWIENKGIAHPIIHNEKTHESQSEFMPMQSESSDVEYNLSFIDSTGFRIA